MATYQGKIGALLKRIQDGSLNVKDLPLHTRREIAIYLFDTNKFSYREISQITGYTVQGLYNINERRKKSFEVLARKIEPNRLVGLHIANCEHACIQLAKEGKWREWWLTKRELLDDLMKLGYLKRAPLEIKSEITYRREEIIERIVWLLKYDQNCLPSGEEGENG